MNAIQEPHEQHLRVTLATVAGPIRMSAGECLNETIAAYLETSEGLPIFTTTRNGTMCPWTSYNPE